MAQSHRLPLLLAAVITLLNAAKPAVVDDTAYLLFARHLAADPLHPYAFELFWYTHPEPAMDILLPPVLPYWLAAGMTLFGEDLPLLKLWLFPFAWVLCLSVRSLLRRFAPGGEGPGTVAFCLSPAVLPLTSVMLDVPALALGAAAAALFVKGCDPRRWWCVLLAGVCTALAVQTKYSMLTVPCVLVGYGFTRLGRPHSVWAMLAAVVAVGLGAALFAGWEWYLVRTHGQSHFLLHLKGNAGDGGDLWRKLGERFAFAQPLVGQFGGLAGGVSLAAAAGVGWPRAVRVGAAALLAGGVALGCTLPHPAAAPLGPRYDLPFVVFGVCGLSVVVTAGLGLVRVLARRAADADTLFLVGWVVAETLGMLGMTPFPAARRVIGVCLAVAVLLFHLVAKLTDGNPRVPRWAVGFAVGLGVVVWAVDWWDAQPEKVLVERAAGVAKPEPGRTVWFTGHWGFQWYCDRAGMRHLNPWPGGTPMKAGDWLVTPLPPDEHWFFRPCPFTTTEPEYDPVTRDRIWRASDSFPRPDMRLERADGWVWLDGLTAQTIPTMYGGGSAPLGVREHPRLRVAVYRVLEDWWP